MANAPSNANQPSPVACASSLAPLGLDVEDKRAKLRIRDDGQRARQSREQTHLKPAGEKIG